MEVLIVAVVIAVLAVVVVVRSVRIVPQARARNVERLGRYHRTLEPGLNFIIPFVDRVRPQIDLREQVVSFQPQPVITEDNLVVNIDNVLYFHVTDARAAAYEISNFIQAAEQLTVTTLRNVIGGMTLEETLTSRRRSTASCGACWTRPRQVGHPGQPGGDQGDRPAGPDQAGHGEADAGRP